MLVKNDHSYCCMERERSLFSEKDKEIVEVRSCLPGFFKRRCLMIRLPKFQYAFLALFTLSVALQSPVDASVSTFGTGLNQFEMTFVEIGNPGNDADPRRYGTPQGSVAYAYQLGKYEVSRDMITKYNANFGTNNGQAIDMGSMWRYGGTRDAMPATESVGTRQPVS